MQIPPVRYARGRDGAAVAYRVFGDGEPLVMMTSWVAALDGMWEQPAHLRMWRVLSTVARVVMFDPRGFGASDPIDPDVLLDPDERATDVITVLDELGVESATVWAEADAVKAAITLAVREPSRVRKLIFQNGWAFVTDPIPAPEEQDAFAREWGSGEFLCRIVPWWREDVEWAARLERAAAPPAIAALTLLRGRQDLRHLLPLVEQPCLIIHTGESDHVGYDSTHSKVMAEAIRNAELIETTSTSFYWGGGHVDALLRFHTGREERAGERDLAAVVFYDIVDSTGRAVRAGDAAWKQTLDFADDLVQRRVGGRGRIVKSTGDGHLLELGRPSDAIEVAREIVKGAHALELEVRVGIHVGEIERREDGDIGGIAVHIAARVCALAGDGEVLVTRTVTELVTGGGDRFEPRGDHVLRGVPGSWSLSALWG